MSDTEVVASAKAKKQATAIRDWIDANAKPVEGGDEHNARGLRYTHLATARRINPAYNPETDSPPDEAQFDVIFADAAGKIKPDMEKVTLMLAIFGGLTLAGNVVNTATNGPKGDPNADVITLIEERFNELAAGTWADRATGVGGVRYNKDLLAQAIASAKGEGDTPEDGAKYLAKMDNKVDPKTGAVVAADTKGAISYGAFALRNATVKQAYDALTGGGVDIGSL